MRGHLQKGDALLVIDMQNDFCPGGALPVEHGDKVVPVLNRWIQKTIAAGVPVYASRNWHPVGHVSFAESGGSGRHIASRTQRVHGFTQTSSCRILP